MTDETVRIGLIGAGANTRNRHIPGFQAIEGVELVAVANRSRESGQRIADEFGIAKVYDTWVDLLEAPDLDAVCIGTWPYTHRTMVLAALERDKHVLTEARLSMDAAQAREMLEATRRYPHLVAQVVPAPFTLPADATIKELIADGYCGDILSVDLMLLSAGSSGGGFIDRDGPFMWRHDRDLSGHNIMLMGAWYECLMRLLGPATSVSAITRVNVKARRDAAGQLRTISIPDHVEVLFEMASGPVGHMRCSEVTGLVPGEEVWIFGSEGTLRLVVEGHGDKNTLSGGRRGDTGLTEIELLPEKMGGWRVEEEFVNAIRGIEPVTHNTFDTGLKYMEFTEAVTRSAQSRRTVHLPL